MKFTRETKVSVTMHGDGTCSVQASNPNGDFFVGAMLNEKVAQALYEALYAHASDEYEINRRQYPQFFDKEENHENA